MSKQTEALKLALEALEYISSHYMSLPKIGCMALAAVEEAIAEQPAQQQEPVAYDKTEINCFAQDLYDQKMREGKRGHYESMFHVIHQCIKKVSPPASKPWVGLTEVEIAASKPPLFNDAVVWELAVEWAQSQLKEKNK